MSTTVATRIIVPMTLICGGTAVRAAPQTQRGKVTSWPELKRVMMKSSTERAKAKRAAARIPGRMRGKVTLRNVCYSFAPRSMAASSRVQSKPRSRAFTVTTT